MTVGRAPRGTLREPLGLTLLALFVGATLLLVGQAAQLSRLLGGTAGVPWPQMLGYGLVALGEVLLPLCGLAGMALAFGRWRTEHHLTALWSFGVHPVQVLGPAVGVGLALGMATAPLASTWGPRALAALSTCLTEALAQVPFSPGGMALGRAGLVRGVVHPNGSQGELWGVVAGAEAGGPPTILRAERAVFDGEGMLVLSGVHFWNADFRAVLDRATVSGGDALRRPGSLRPPNTLVSDALDPREPLEMWSLHRRRCLAVMAPVLTVLGALLGGSLGRTPALLGGAALMGLCYWGLRLGSLGVRAGSLSPGLAGWLPLLFLLPAAALIGAGLWRRFRA